MHARVGGTVVVVEVERAERAGLLAVAIDDGLAAPGQDGVEIGHVAGLPVSPAWVAPRRVTTAIIIAVVVLLLVALAVGAGAALAPAGRRAAAGRGARSPRRGRPTRRRPPS